MSTVVYGLITMGFLIGAIMIMLALTKPGRFLSIILKPIFDRLQKRFERKMMEEEMKLNKARKDMEAAREKAYVSFMNAEEAERRYQVAQSPAYRENVELKMLRELEEENEKLRQRIAESKKRQKNSRGEE